MAKERESPKARPAEVPAGPAGAAIPTGPADATQVEQVELRAPAPAPPAAPAPAKPRRALVHVPNTHVGTIEVEIPADAADPTSAAVEAAKAARGIVKFGSSPEVEFLD